MYQKWNTEYIKIEGEENMLDELKKIVSEKEKNAAEDYRIKMITHSFGGEVERAVLQGQIQAYVDVLATIKMLEDKNNDK